MARCSAGGSAHLAGSRDRPRRRCEHARATTHNHEGHPPRMRKFLIGLMATLSIAAPLAVAAAPAEAATNTSCATRAEFRRIHVGQNVRTTQSIIGSRGRLTMAGSYMSQRQWRVCGSPYSYVTLTYVSGRLNNKIML